MADIIIGRVAEQEILRQRISSSSPELIDAGLAKRF